MVDNWMPNVDNWTRKRATSLGNDVAFTNERHLAREWCLPSRALSLSYLFASCMCGKKEKRTGNNPPSESDGCATPESNAPPISAGSIFIPRSNYSRADWNGGINSPLLPPLSSPFSSASFIRSLQYFLRISTAEWIIYKHIEIYVTYLNICLYVL